MAVRKGSPSCLMISGRSVGKMGGRGSGRPASYAVKPTTEDSLPLDIRRMQRIGVLTPGWTCR